MNVNFNFIMASQPVNIATGQDTSATTCSTPKQQSITRRLSTPGHHLPNANAMNIIQETKRNTATQKNTTSGKIKNTPKLSTAGHKRKHSPEKKGNSPDSKKCQIEEVSEEDLDNLDLRELMKLSIKRTDNMQKSMSTFMADFKQDQKKTQEQLTNIESTLKEHATSLEFTNKRIEDVETKLKVDKEQCIQQIEQVAQNENNLRDSVKKMKEVQKTLKTGLNACEGKLSDLQLKSPLRAEPEEFPVSRTLVLQHVMYLEGENILKVVRGIIHRCLGLSDVNIELAKRISVREDGTGLVKVRLSNKEELVTVLKNKMKLRENRSEDIARIWIRQSKTKEQMMNRIRMPF